MSPKVSGEILEQQIKSLELENAALKQDIATLESIFKSAPVGLAVVIDHKIIRANKCLCDITGYSMAELTGSDTKIVFPDEASYLEALALKSDPDVRNGSRSFETRWQTKEGRIIDIRLTYSPIDEHDFSKGLTVTVQNITTHKKNEDFLKFQAKVLNSINDIVRVLDLEGNIIYVNDTHNRIMNTSLHQAMDKNFGRLMRESYFKDPQKDIIDKTVRYGTWRAEVAMACVDGEIIDVDFRTQLIIDSDTEPQYVVCIGTNITKKKRSEKERELFLAAIEQSPQAIFIINSEGIIRYANNAFERQTGYLRPDCIGMDLRMLRSGKHDRQFYINLWAAISSGRMWNGDMISKRKDGSLYTADTTISSVKDKNGTITNYVGVQRDISNEIEINEKIAKLQKFESLGTLAGGMVHDLNNMLFPILGNAEVLLLDASAYSSETKEILEQIYESALQAKDLVQQVLAFSRHKKIERRPLLIQNSIYTVLKLMRFGIPGNISIEKAVDPNCPLIIADSTQIHQVIMNLISNSIHAIDNKGGVIKISLIPEKIGRFDSDAGIKPGNYICLSVSDTGAGMSTEAINHIFEPFYTTKGNGKGTGMGLSVVYGIINDMDGGIKVYSRPGKGSEFKIYFPSPLGKHINAPSYKVAVDDKTGTGEHINVLFVDDEDIILKVAKSMLDRLGCHTVAMPDPLEALAHFKKEPFTYNLVITDMYMPHMTGDCLAENIREIRPDIPIFFCTGFSNDITLDMMVRLGISSVLSKPLSIKEISDKLKETLNAEIPAKLRVNSDGRP